MFKLFFHFSHRLLSRLTAFILLCATLPGCLSPYLIGNIAEGERKEPCEFALSASVNTYIITRMFSDEQKTSSIPRRDLPKGCETARFFLNDSDHELKVAQPIFSSGWVTGIQPPLPDDNYPPCSLLVSYGTFSGPPMFEGVAITTATGLVATSERQQPNPIAWALLPVGVVAEFYILIGALVTSPVWAPIAIIWENGALKREQEAKEKERSALPPPVAACWTAIDGEIKNNPQDSLIGFEWVPGNANSYILTTANEVFNDDNPVLIDARVKLLQGRTQFLNRNNRPLSTDADVECGLRTGDVVATRVILRK